MGRPIRIGAVRYLNARPLVYRLQELVPEAEVIYDLPSRLADGLAEGTLDVALIPSVEYFRGQGYRIVPGIAIAARGPVRSVKLYTRVPLAEIKTLALDEGSRTSAALVQVWLARYHGLHPQIQPLPIGVSPEECPADAVLAIGDRGMYPAPEGEFLAEYDLADEWLRATGRPFVFAFWAVAPGVVLGPVEEALLHAREAGLAHAAEIAEAAAAELELPYETCYEYLTKNICYEFDEPEREGLLLFYRWSCELGLVPANVELRFYDRAHPAEVPGR